MGLGQYSMLPPAELGIDQDEMQSIFLYRGRWPKEMMLPSFATLLRFHVIRILTELSTRTRLDPTTREVNSGSCCGSWCSPGRRLVFAVNMQWLSYSACLLWLQLVWFRRCNATREIKRAHLSFYRMVMLCPGAQDAQGHGPCNSGGAGR